MNVNMTEKFETVDGREATIYTTEHPGKYPVIGSVKGVYRTDDSDIYSWTLEGKFYDHRDSKNDLRKISKWSNFKKGDNVVVWDYANGTKQRRVFCEADGDRARTYDGGHNEWTAGKYPETSGWKFCIKREDYDENVHGSI